MFARRLLSLCALACLPYLGAASCVGDAGNDAGFPPFPSPETDAGTEEPADGGPLCTPDPSLIAQRLACLRTEDCPCGTSCDRGECVAECEASSDCGDDQWCDTFGTCRHEDSLDLVPELTEGERGAISFQPAFLAMPTGTEERRLGLVGEGDTPNIRVLASAGLELSCDEGATWESECLIEFLETGEVRDLRVRGTSAFAEDELRRVTAFSATDVKTVSVAEREPADPDAVTPPQFPDFDAVYRGAARMVEAGLAIQPVGYDPGNDAGTVIEVTGGSEPPAAVRVPVTVEVFATGSTPAYLLRVTDPMNVLHPSGELVLGAESGAPGDVLAEHHPYVDVELETVENQQADGFRSVRARYTSTYLGDFDGTPNTYLPDFGGTGSLDSAQLLSARGFAFDLLAFFDTSDRPQRAPAARWQISVTRVADHPDDVTAPTHDLGSYTPPPYTSWSARQTVDPTLWERAAWNAIGRSASAGLKARRGEAAHLAACVPLERRGQSIGPEIDLATQGFLIDWIGRESEVSGPGVSYARVSTGEDMEPALPEGGGLHLLASFFVDGFGLDIANTEVGYEYGVGTPVILAADVTNPDNTALDGPAMRLAGIPCEYSFAATDVEFIDSNQAVPTVVTLPAQTYDRCGELASVYDCDVEDLASPKTATYEGVLFGSHFDLSLPGGNVRSILFDDDTYPIVATTSKVCRLPPAAPVCADMVQCHSGSAEDGASSSYLSTTVATESGDAACESGERTFGFDADRAEGFMRAGEMLAACFADLSRLDDAPAPGASLEDLFASEGCVSVGRFLTALGSTTEVLRLDAYQALPEFSWPVVTSSRRAHRLLQRWLELHDFVANEVEQTDALTRIIRRNPTGGELLPPTLDEALLTSMAGWRVFLHPRFATALERIPGDVLNDPDYRRALPANATTEQARGLPVAMLETLASQMSLLVAVVERARFTGDDAVRGLVSESLRTMIVVQAQATGLAQRAHDACDMDTCPTGEPVWFERYRLAGTRLDAAVIRVLNALRAFDAEDNPFGIEESDLPLYFFGGATDDDSRFFAISDYLLGKNAGTAQNWAPTLVADALHKEEAARSAWTERFDRIVATNRDAQARAIRVVDTQSEFGDRILELCGRPEDLFAADVLEQWEDKHTRPFSAGDCYVEVDRFECLSDVGRYMYALSNDQFKYVGCMFEEVSRRAPGRVRAATPELTALFENCAAENLQPDRSFPPRLLCNASIEWDLNDISGYPGGFMQLRYDDVDPSAMLLAQQTCGERFEHAQLPLPPSDVWSEFPLDCYRGAIGEQFLALRGLVTEIAIARTEASDLIDAYNIEMEACMIEKATGNRLTSMRSQHNKHMSALRKVKLAADIISNVAGGVKDCMATAAGTETMRDGFTIGACGAAAVEAAADSISDGMQFAMDQAEAAFELASQQVEVEGAFRACKQRARHYLVGTNSQALRILKAVDEMEAAVRGMRNAQQAAQLAFEDGVATVAAERERNLSPLTHDLWLDEKVDAYVSAFRLAHRVTYLSVRAVEYEFQQSLATRELVLEAENALDLENAIRELRSYTAPRSVNGSRPTEKKAILSLRDDLLGLEDRDAVPDGFYPLDATERLRLLLRSERYAVYSETGEYLGQRIPFELAPRGFEDERVTQIYSQDSCAERLWSVNASILGDDELLDGVDSTFTNITVMKSNTFFSQWCDESDRATDYQLASVRPERNLFRDPQAGSSPIVDLHVRPMQGEGYAKALIQPTFNVDRASFEDDQYENGDSSQLAGRGLYGEYVLFFPAQSLSRIDKDGVSQPGLDLAHVDDVLIRLDYLTAAR